ncbi:MAG TPA: cation transporter [Flavobacterium sp.]|jgi:cation transport ATPase|nr:cation transporter [Flavobacterium sp.]
MKNLILAAMLFVASFSMQAQEKSKNAKHNVSVSGNCDQCKKRIEKAAYSVSGVKSAVYHLDDQMLHLIVNEEKTSVVDVQKAVAKAGHDTQDTKATDTDYENLHFCCKYERKN